MGIPDGAISEDDDWAASVKAYYRDVESYDWVDVADNFRGLESIFHRRRRRLVLDHLPNLHLGLVLDAGCGTGLNLRQLPHGSVGLDLNPRGLTKVKDQCSDSLLVQADIDDLPFADMVFDAVVCTEVLEHLPNPKRAVDELLRVLRPGGTLLGTVPSRSPVWRLRFLSRTCPAQEPFHNQYSRPEVRSLLSGYIVRSVAYALAGTSLVFTASRPSE